MDQMNLKELRNTWHRITYHVLFVLSTTFSSGSELLE